ncbi:unnamed protein product [Phaeothamnion confervicola]
MFRVAGNVLRGAFVAVPMAVTFRDLVGTVLPVTGRSMQPTLNPNAQGEDATQDYVWEASLAVWDKVDRGDVVSFRSPFNPDEKLVKRLIAMDGDWVRPGGGAGGGIGAPLLHVPRGHCWVEGDNPVLSDDSNSYGPIPMALLEGRVTHVLWPPHRVGPLKKAIPGTSAVRIG